MTSNFTLESSSDRMEQKNGSDLICYLPGVHSIGEIVQTMGHRIDETVSGLTGPLCTFVIACIVITVRHEFKL